MALWYGGFVQLLAGMWAMKVGNTFEATAFTSFGAFWIAFGMVYIPFFGIRESYKDLPPHSFQNAMGILLFTWGVFSVILFIATLKSTITTSLMFLFLIGNLFFLAGNDLGHHSEDSYPKKIGAVCGLITSILAFYNGAAALWVPSNSHILLPVGPIYHHHDDEDYMV
jgi:succinate-acetate transporter protein